MTLWLFQLSDIYPVLLLEDNGTIGSLCSAVYLKIVQLQSKRVTAPLCFWYGARSKYGVRSLKFIQTSVLCSAGSAKTAPGGSWKQGLFSLEACCCA